MLYFLVFCCYWWQSWNNSHALSPRFLLLLWTRLEQQSCFTSSFSVVTGDKVGTIVMLYLLVFSCYCDKVGTTVMLYFLVFSCYWWQSWNNSHALSPRFLLLLVTKLEQQSCFTSSFSVVTGDKVGTTVMLYLPRFLLLLVTKLEQQSCFTFSLVTLEQQSCFTSSFSVVTGDKVGTIVMLYLPVFSCYCGQGWNTHALLPRFLLLLVTKLEQQSCFTSSFSVVTGDKVGTTVMLYLPVFSCYWWTRLKQQSCFTSSFSVVTGDKVGTIVMLYLPVFSCYWWQSWNNSHALLPRFLLLLVTKLEQ